MITNISIELTDEERNNLKVKLDRKDSKKLLSRDEVREMCRGMFDGMLAAGVSEEAPVEAPRSDNVSSIFDHPWYQADPEDRDRIMEATKGRGADYRQSFTYGFNKVKHTPRGK